MTYYLIPIHDSSQSFYNKAVVEQSKKSLILYSYNTKVAEIKNNKVILNNKIDDSLLFSNTTLRHIKEFLKQNGFKAETKKQIINDYMEV
ncbi:MAG TPA: hypothetical protein GX745_03940 [Clostridiales bacterium]|nr:hypothetical protein [Clostridiales bacterium]